MPDILSLNVPTIRDGNINTDMYFDKVGNPVALSKGQYGIKYSGKIMLLLNKKGHAMLCVDNILNGFPFYGGGIRMCALLCNIDGAERMERSFDRCLCSVYSL